MSSSDKQDELVERLIAWCHQKSAEAEWIDSARIFADPHLAERVDPRIEELLEMHPPVKPTFTF